MNFTGMIFGFPCRTLGEGRYEVVEGLSHDEFGQKKMVTTLQELQAEREAVSELLG